VTKTKNSKKRWALIPLIVLVLLLAGAAIVWVQRAALLGWGVSRYCSDRDLVCELTAENVSFDKITLTDITVNAPSSEEGLTIDRLELVLSWTGLKLPSLSGVTIDGADLDVGYDGQSLFFYGLEALAPAPSEDSAASLPTITLTNGRFDIDTPAGTLRGTASLENRLGLRRLDAKVAPAHLQNGTNSLDLVSAEVFVNLDDQADDAVLFLNV